MCGQRRLAVGRPARRPRGSVGASRSRRRGLPRGRFGGRRALGKLLDHDGASLSPRRVSISWRHAIRATVRGAVCRGVGLALCRGPSLRCRAGRALGAARRAIVSVVAGGGLVVAAACEENIGSARARSWSPHHASPRRLVDRVVVDKFGVSHVARVGWVGWRQVLDPRRLHP
jgi:hypothetical protein